MSTEDPVQHDASQEAGLDDNSRVAARVQRRKAKTVMGMDEGEQTSRLRVQEAQAALETTLETGDADAMPPSDAHGEASAASMLAMDTRPAWRKNLLAIVLGAALVVVAIAAVMAKRTADARSSNYDALYAKAKAIDERRVELEKQVKEAGETLASAKVVIDDLTKRSTGAEADAAAKAAEVTKVSGALKATGDAKAELDGKVRQLAEAATVAERRLAESKARDEERSFQIKRLSGDLAEAKQDAGKQAEALRKSSADAADLKARLALAEDAAKKAIDEARAKSDETAALAKKYEELKASVGKRRPTGSERGSRSAAGYGAYGEDPPVGDIGQDYGQR